MTPFARQLAARCPMPVADWMAACAAQYYATREPFGAAGDFITAPEISQMFGELVGAWAADLWQRAGSPPLLRLVELGPGRGTLMRDLWRATARLPGFHDAAQVHFVETSHRLRALQAEALPGAVWHDAMSEVPDDAPLLLVANEFFDALPVAQLVLGKSEWTERMVSFDGASFVVEAALHDCIRETSPAATAIATRIGERLRAHGGAALIIDYGYSGPAFGDTLQAIRDGQRADPFEHPGEADLTCHVDFAALAAAAQATAYGPVPQGVWLRRLGIDARADTLKARADLTTRAQIAAAAARLTSASGMGASFNVLALTGRGWPEPAGFAP